MNTNDKKIQMMKTKINLLILCFGILLCTNCSKDEILTSDEELHFSAPASTPSTIGTVTQLNEIVVLYNANNQTLKDNFYEYLGMGNAGDPNNGIPAIDATTFNIVTPITCLGSNIEKFEIKDGSPIEIIIEHLKKKPELTEEEEDLEDFWSIIQAVDINFLFDMDSGLDTPEGLEQGINSYSNYTNSDPGAIKIAVLDSGFLPSTIMLGNGGSFLYDSSQNPCSSTSGWDFVKSNENPLDEHPQKHGTLTTYLLHNALKDYNVPYRIIPARVANGAGSIEYFNLMKAMEYVIKEGVSVVNMSFGWYGNSDNTSILSYFVSENPNIYFVCSAGNDGINLDNYETHYPSGLDFRNVFSVTATNKSGDDFVSQDNQVGFFSNYGSNAVDFAAHGVDVVVTSYDGHDIYLPSTNQPYVVHGTSFAAPKAAAIISAFIYSNDYNIPANEFKNLLNNPNDLLDYGVYGLPLNNSVNGFVPTYFNLHLDSFFQQ